MTCLLRVSRGSSAACFLGMSILIVGPVTASERTWIKYHDTVEFGDNLVAEYTAIGTADSQFPNIIRYLYRDQAGERFVIRHNTSNVDGVGMFSVESVTSGEILEIEIASDRVVTVTLNQVSLSFDDADEFPANIRAAGLQLIENASQEFRGGLSRLAAVGTQYSTMAASIAFVLRELFFHHIQLVGTPADYTTPPTDLVYPFDPAIYPPGTFEQPFGQAYYQ